MNYGQIRTQFKAILNRSDCSDALADTFITQGLSRSQRILRIPSNEQQLVYTVPGGFTSLTVPTDLMETIDLTVDSKVPQFLPPKRFAEVSIDTNGIPQYWTRTNGVIKFKPTPSTGAVVTLNYYGAFDAFSGDSSTTSLSVLAPDLLIYGGLSYAADYFIDERKALFEDRYTQIAAELQAQAYDTDGAGQVQPAYDLEGH
jgi:hypothetical protein